MKTTFLIPIDIASATVVLNEPATKKLTVTKATVNEADVAFLSLGLQISILQPLKKGDKLVVEYEEDKCQEEKHTE